MTQRTSGGYQRSKTYIKENKEKCESFFVWATQFQLKWVLNSSTDLAFKEVYPEAHTLVGTGLVRGGYWTSQVLFGRVISGPC